MYKPFFVLICGLKFIYHKHLNDRKQTRAINPIFRNVPYYSVCIKKNHLISFIKMKKKIDNPIYNK